MKFRILPLLMVLGTTTLAAQVTPLDEFHKLDRNGDGRLSAAEAKVRPDLEAAFESLDKNHDGFLSPEEFGIWHKTVDPTTGPSGSNGAQHMPKE
jgi:Ca2+-binding EF-hand superfamily protein